MAANRQSSLGCIAAKVNEHLVASYHAAFGFPVILVSGIAAFVLDQPYFCGRIAVEI